MKQRKHNTGTVEHLPFADRLALLTKQAHNKSPKPLKRLKAALAAMERTQLLANLPGSAKRGLSRGHAAL